MANRVKKANTFVFWFFKLFIRPALYIMYRFRFEKNTSKGIKRPCFILSNHQTVIDQFAVCMGFNFGINFVGSDTLFRYGLKSKLMMLIARPIPFSKGNSDLTAVRNMISVIKDGGCVAMFPSGNRSFYGEESTIVKGIGKMARKFNAPLVLVRLRGGFFTMPRWKVKASKGKMRACVTKVVPAQELAAMTNAEVDEIIQKELGFNDFEYNNTARIAFHGKHKAEYLESVLFYCPECSSLTGLYSQGDEFSCRGCGMKVRINDTGFFEKISKAQNVPDTILQWSYKQLDYIKKFDYSGFSCKPLFSDDNISLSIAERAKNEHFLGKGSIEFFCDRFTACGQEFYFFETTMAVQGVRKLTIYNKDSVYAVEVPFRTNLMKYMICGFHLRNNILKNDVEYFGY
ncbi:MAG: 1-acyl-sn-glycerol-3-phosphate acyltransferase [Treponema sp.]|nr:1-acyl-sn-glycerol-3-phosphate acyltransferase [Treponema sp.]